MPRTPGFWSLNSLLAAVLGTITAVAAVVIITAGTTGPDTAQSEIIAATETFFEATASGDRTALAQVVCAKEMATYSDPAVEPAAKSLRTVAEIVINGETATGTMVIEELGKPELGSSLAPMIYVNEDGWKLCP